MKDASVAATAVVCLYAWTAAAFLGPAPPNLARCSATTKWAASSSQEKPLSWQESIELLVSPTTSLSQKQVLLQDVVARAPEIRKDVQEAIREGDVDSLLTDGVRAVRRQLVEDILPTIAADPQQTARVLMKELPRIARSSYNQLPKDPKGWAEAVREAANTLPTEARNVFLKTPEGLETPQYRYEIREYDSYTVAYTDMDASKGPPATENPKATGAAFNTLASYIFGYNTGRESLAMTTPVEIRKDGRVPGAGEYEMRFSLGSKYTTETAPRPSSPKVRLTTTPQERLAVRKFPGFATEGEVSRQLISLLSALDRDGVEIIDPASYRILQYNPPYTLPWLRSNEIVVQVRNLPANGVRETARIVRSDAPATPSRDGQTYFGQNVVEGSAEVAQGVSEGFEEGRRAAQELRREVGESGKEGVERSRERLEEGLRRGTGRVIRGLDDGTREGLERGLERAEEGLEQTQRRFQEGQEFVSTQAEAGKEEAVQQRTSPSTAMQQGTSPSTAPSPPAAVDRRRPDATD